MASQVDYVLGLETLRSSSSDYCSTAILRAAPLSLIPWSLTLLASMVMSTAGVAQQSRASEYVTVRLPHGVEIQMPRNWRILTDDSRITLNAASETLVHQVDLEWLPSSLPFAANYYDGARTTAGILNARYYPTQTLTQSAVRAMRPSDLQELDALLREQLVSAVGASGNRIIEWLGTRPRDIDGMRFLVTTYRRTSAIGGTFHVRLVRLLDASRSFTMTISYREDEKLLVPITDFMIGSLKVERTGR